LIKLISSLNKTIIILQIKMMEKEKDFIVITHDFDKYYVPKKNILYIKGSVAHGSDDYYIIRLMNGEEIEQKGFKELQEKLELAESMF